MARSYGLDLRQRVVEAIDAGMSARAAAARFSVGASTAINRHRRWRETRRIAPGRQGKPRRSKLDAHEAFILELVGERRDIALHEIAEALATERGVATCPASVWYFFSRRGLTFKKRRAMPANGSARTSSRSARTGSTTSSISTRTG